MTRAGPQPVGHDGAARAASRAGLAVDASNLFCREGDRHAHTNTHTNHHTTGLEVDDAVQPQTQKRGDQLSPIAASSRTHALVQSFFRSPSYFTIFAFGNT